MKNRNCFFKESQAASWLPLFLSLAFGATISLVLGQDYNWDLRNYHFYNVYAWFNNRYLFDLAPAQRQTFLNPLLDLPFYGLVQTLNDKPRLVAVLLGAWQGLNYYVVWHIARLLLVIEDAPRLSLIAASLATVIGATGASLLPVLGSTMNDAPATTLVLLALYLLLRATRCERKGSTPVWLAGLLVGCSVGLKLTMGLYAVGVLVALAVWYGPRRFLSQGLRFCLAAGVGLLVVDGFFLWKMWQLFKNPLFPFYNNLFHSPYAAPQPFDDPRFLTSSFWQALAYPFIWGTRITTLVSEPPLRDPRFGAVLTLGVIMAGKWLCSRSPRPILPRRWLGLLFFFGTTYCLWISKFVILRYLAGLELLTGILLCAGLLSLFHSSRQAVLAMACLTAILLVTTRYPDWGRLPFAARIMDVQAPSVPPQATVFTLNDEGIAYVIPFFDPRIRFIALNNNLVKPGQYNLLRSDALDLLQHQPDPIFALEYPTGIPTVEESLRTHGLKNMDGTCAPIFFNGQDTALRVCQVYRIYDPGVDASEYGKKAE